MEVVISLITLAIIIVPLWKIMRKTGQNPAISLLVVIPIIGPLIYALVFGYGRWPKYPDEAS